jgi:hypothetical protein
LNDDLGPTRRLIVNGCDVALVPLVYWQAMGAPQPATVIATGVVLATRKAASMHWWRNSG